MAPEHVDYEKERSPSPSPSDSHDEKPRNEASLEEPNPDAVEPQEYPQGIKLVFIVIALIMSIFLISLDMVCTSFVDNLLR